MNDSRRARGNVVRGFTLIEIIVAVGVLGMMTVLIFGIMSSMFAVAKDTDELVDVNHMARISMNRMTRDLSQAFLSLNQGIEELTKTVFIGERDRIVFAYVGNVPVKAGQLQTDQGVVEYRLGSTSEGRPGRDLIRRFKPYIDDDPEDGGEEFVMASGVTKLSFEYWDRQNEEWDDEWKAEDPLSNVEPGYELPPRVKIRIELADNMGGDHVFETQTSIYMTKPLLFGQPISQKAQQHEAKEKLKDLEEAGEAARGMLQGGGLTQ